MLDEPVGCGRACANRSANENADWSAGEAANQHSTSCSPSHFELVAPVVA